MMAMIRCDGCGWVVNLHSIKGGDPANHSVKKNAAGDESVPFRMCCGTWRKVERKPRMTEAERLAAGWEKRWGLQTGAGNWMKKDGKRWWSIDHRQVLSMAVSVHGTECVGYWHRRKPKPAAASPREVADLREHLQIAEDALRLARADAVRAEASAEDWKRLHKGADAERISFLTGELAAAEAERDRLRAETAAPSAYRCPHYYDLMICQRFSGHDGAHWYDSSAAGRTAPVPHPANVMAAEAIAREAAPLRVGDHAQVSYSGRVTHIAESGRYMHVMPDATSGIPQSVHAEAVRRLPEPTK